MMIIRNEKIRHSPFGKRPLFVSNTVGLLLSIGKNVWISFACCSWYIWASATKCHSPML